MFRVKEEVTDQLSLKVPRAYNPVAEPANFHIVLLSRYFSDLKILFLAIKRSLVFIFPLLLTLLNALYNDATHDCALNICKILQVHDIRRRGSRITTDQFPKRAPKTKACVLGGGGGSIIPWEIFWILTSLSPLSRVSESFRQDIGQFHWRIISVQNQ